MSGEMHGRIRSGDVDIFFRKFGKPGATPMLLLHGGNYYDSSDWIDIATALSYDREVVAFDARGFGESGWSPSKNYSHSAHIADALGLLDYLGWKTSIVVGHSRGGAYALLFAARHPDRTAGLVVIDYCPGFGIGPRGIPVVESQSIGNQPKVFANSKAALASTSRFAGAAEDSAYRRRFDGFLRQVPGGVVLAKRDPDFSNQVPIVTGSAPALKVGDMWAEVDRVSAPALVFRALNSKAGYTDDDLERLRREYPEIDVVEIASDHDIPAEAPDELVREIKVWVSRRDLGPHRRIGSPCRTIKVRLEKERTMGESGRSNTQQAYERLRADVLACRLSPGTRLRINDLCSELGVSLGAVREALSRLTSEGLVIAEPHRGFRVTEISREELEDLTNVRVDIEAKCLARAIAVGSLAWESRLVAIYHELSRTPERTPNDPQRLNDSWSTLHRAYHEALVSACDSPWLLKLRSILYAQSERYRQLSVPLARTERNIDEEHRQIVDAVIARDTEKACSLLKTHISRTTDILMEATTLSQDAATETSKSRYA